MNKAWKKAWVEEYVGNDTGKASPWGELEEEEDLEWDRYVELTPGD